jgi:hypothetical protein
MSETTQDIITQEQAQHVEAIKLYHGKFLESFGDQMGYAFLTGVELNALKETCEHGDFTELKKRFLPDVPTSSMGLYMKFATGMVSKFPTVGNLLPEAGRFEGENRQKLLEAVHEVTDGKTLTEMYRETGALRPKKAKENHPAKELNPEEQLQAEIAQAEALVSALAGEILLSLEGDTLAKVKPASRKALLDAAIALTKKLRTFKKKKGAAAK